MPFQQWINIFTEFIVTPEKLTVGKQWELLSLPYLQYRKDINLFNKVEQSAMQ